jgi:GNAT superfamily N-acetyltransferase
VTGDVEFRAATVDDLDPVHRLVEAAYRDPHRSGWTTEAGLLGGQRTDPDMLDDLFAEPHTALVVGALDDDVVACGALQIHPTNGDAHFGLFAVNPDRQGQGIGSNLLGHVEQLAVRAGATHLTLEVIDVRTDLLQWYERRGYRGTGASLPFPYGDERFGVPRRTDLRFAVLVKDLARET